MPEKFLFRLRATNAQRAIPSSVSDEDAQRWGLTVAKREGRFVSRGVTDVWLERELDNKWTAAYRLVMSGGRLRVGEVRVFPSEPDFARRAEGEWSGVWRGVMADAPRQGLTGRVVRAAGKVHGWAGQLNLILANLVRLFGQERVEAMLGRERFGLPVPPLKREGTRRGRKPKPERFYAEIARDYVNALKAGRHPVQTVAEKHNEPQTVRVRGWIHRARVYGFIEGGTQGKAEGQLSMKALFHLEPRKQQRRASQSGKRQRKTMKRKV